MKNLRVGVVGVGHIGSNHARLYAEIPSAEFTAVYDVDPVANRTIATKFGATPARSLDEFIAMIDAASVATPTNTHYEVARTLLAKGKHVLVEKPITDNTAHATELAELAARNGPAAAAEFQKFLDHTGVSVNFPLGALAHLGLARAYALSGDTAKAKAAYQDFFALWKDADPDIPILKEAKADYAKLQ